jgi:nucleotide-binding universal stress UspA family protein
VCAVEPSPRGLDVLERARRIAAPAARLIAVTVLDEASGLSAVWAAPPPGDERRREAEQIHVEADRRLGGEPWQRAVLRTGIPLERLREEIDRHDADLVVVGTDGHGRAAGLITGSTSTILLHEAPCPVLLVRPGGPPHLFPRSITVGVDGSRHSAAAAEVAHELGGRLGVPVRAVVASGGAPVDLDGLLDLDGIEWLDAPPVEALTGACGPADLLVLGSRGLRGLAAVGSVSERVAHRAPCSVLVVRPTVARSPARPTLARERGIMAATTDRSSSGLR